jgi:hypothetical protein
MFSLALEFHRHLSFAALWPSIPANILIQLILKRISFETHEIGTNLYILLLLITDSISFTGSQTLAAIGDFKKTDDDQKIEF